MKRSLAVVALLAAWLAPEPGQVEVPAGTPHWFKDVPSSGVTYYMVKVVRP